MVASQVAAEIQEAISPRNLLAAHGMSDLPLSYDAVLLSGDFTWGGPLPDHPGAFEQGFETARLFVRELVDRRLVTSADGIVLLPGNHDIRWAAPHDGAAGFQLREEAEKYYRQLVREGLPEQLAASGEHLQLQTHLGHLHFFSRPYCDYLLLALNSTRIEAAEQAGVGYVGYDQIYGLFQQIDDERRRSSKPCRVVAALHHHLQPIESIGIRDLAVPRSQRSLSFTTDGFEVLKTLIGMNASVAVHGHMHVPFHYSYALLGPEDHGPESERPLAISAAGSAALAAASGNIRAPHHFQVIEVRENGVRFYSFTAELQPVARTKRQWMLQKLHVPLLNPAPTLDQVCGSLDQDLVAPQLREQAMFDSMVTLSAWTHRDPRARAAVRGEVRIHKLRPEARGNFDAAFEFAEQRLATPEFYAAYVKSRWEDRQKLLFRLVEEEMNRWEPPAR